MTATFAVRLRIHGRVQGVWFRGWTVDMARSLGLRGWVRNCCDGSVEALFIGPPEAIARMVDLARAGPPAARVAHVDREEAADDGSVGFSQRVTV